MLPCHPNGVIILGHKYLREFFDVGEDKFNFMEATFEHTDFRHIFKMGNIYDDWHVYIIRNQLTQNIPALMPDIVDEVTAVLNDEIDTIVTNGILPCKVFVE